MHRTTHILITITLTALSLAMQAQAAALSWKQTSVLADGKWVKVRVDSTGMQQLTHAELRSLGFSNPEKVTVWGYSGAMLNDDRFRSDVPDDLPQTPAIHTAGKLIFYGENHIHTELNSRGEPSHTINPYTTAGYYFLTDSRDALAPATAMPAGADAVPAETHTAILLAERELANWAESGSAWFDTPFSAACPQADYRFALPDRPENSPLHVHYSWVKESGDVRSVELATSPQTALQGTTVSSLPRSLRIAWQTDSAIIASYPSDDITLSFSLSSPDYDVTAAIDWVCITCAAANTLGRQPQATFHLYDAAAIKADLPAGAQLWDVTDQAAAQLCLPDANGVYPVADPAASLHTLVAFNPEATLHTPAAVGQVPAQNLHSMPEPDMLVIAAPHLRSQAEELASLHRQAQNMLVNVVTTTEVANEYGSGSESAYALRRLVRHLYDCGRGRLTYVLLYGTGSFNNRAAAGRLVPTYQCHNRLYMTDDQLSYSTDAYYAMLDNAFSADIAHKVKPSLAVGRIPAATPDEAALYNAKVKAFMLDSDASAFHSSIVMSCDLGDNAEHSSIADNHAARLSALLPGAVVHKIYSDMFPAGRDNTDAPLARQTLIDRLAQGAGLFNYVGHGSSHNLVSKAGGIWLDVAHLAKFSNRHQFLALLSTCYANSFDRTDNTIGAEMLLNPAGAIAVVGNTRSAVSSHNKAFNTFFIREYAALKPGETYGQLWLRTINATLSNYSVSNNGSINTQKYVLLGDPALQVPVPDFAATLSLSADKVSPSQKITVAGSVNGPDGLPAQFNGTATVSVYADSTVVPMLGRNEKQFAGQPVETNSRLLYQGAADVADGRFSLDMLLPAASFADTIVRARVVMHAVADEPSPNYSGRRATAAATPEALTLVSATPAETVFAPAAITGFHVEGDPDGEMNTVSSTPRLIATVDGGETGLDLASTSLTPACALFIDRQRMSGLRFRHAGGRMWTTDFTAPALADGRHQATLTITDNAGNTDSRTISFVVLHNGPAITLQPETAVARESISFVFGTGSFQPTSLRLLIADADGNTVCTQSLSPGTTAIEWNLKQPDGTAVAPGRYTATLLATDQRLYSSSPPVHFVVLP